MRLTALFFILLVAHAGAQVDQYAILHGHILDADGNPVAHAGLCPQWGPLDGKPLEPLGPHTTTDETGAFSLPVIPGFTSGNGMVTVLAFSQQRTQGALIEVPVSDIDKPVTAKLGPIYSARYTLRAPLDVKLSSSPGLVATTSGSPLEPLVGKSGTLALPPGVYTLQVKPGTTGNPLTYSVVLKDRDITLAPILVSVSPLVQHYGHGTPRLSTLQDMEHKRFEIGSVRGRWTLLYFWATWCGPCVKEGIPNLMAFVKEHSESQDQFRIVAIDERRPDEGEDWNAYHRKTLNYESKVWGSVPPFPLTYDETMRMTADWKIHAFPTYVLIDPQGNIVRDGSLELLAMKLDGKPQGKNVGR